MSRIIDAQIDDLLSIQKELRALPVPECFVYPDVFLLSHAEVKLSLEVAFAGLKYFAVSLGEKPAKTGNLLSPLNAEEVGLSTLQEVVAKSADVYFEVKGKIQKKILEKLSKVGTDD